MSASEPYSRARHIAVANEAKEAFQAGSQAMKQAALATCLLNIPLWPVAADLAPTWVMFVALGLWAWPMARALVKARTAHALLHELERMNREAP